MAQQDPASPEPQLWPGDSHTLGPVSDEDLAEILDTDDEPAQKHRKPRL